MVAAAEHRHLRHLPVPDARPALHRLAHDRLMAPPRPLGSRLPRERRAGLRHLLPPRATPTPPPLPPPPPRQVTPVGVNGVYALSLSGIFDT